MTTHEPFTEDYGLALLSAFRQLNFASLEETLSEIDSLSEEKRLTVLTHLEDLTFRNYGAADGVQQLKDLYKVLKKHPDVLERVKFHFASFAPYVATTFEDHLLALSEELEEKDRDGFLDSVMYYTVNQLLPQAHPKDGFEDVCRVFVKLKDNGFDCSKTKANIHEESLARWVRRFDLTRDYLDTRLDENDFENFQQEYLDSTFELLPVSVNGLIAAVIKRYPTDQNLCAPFVLIRKPHSIAGQLQKNGKEVFMRVVTVAQKYFLETNLPEKKQLSAPRKI